MTLSDTWLPPISITGVIFAAIFVFIVPIIGSIKAIRNLNTDKETDLSSFWSRTAVGAILFLVACIIALFVIALVAHDGAPFILGIIAIVGMVAIARWVGLDGDFELDFYFKVLAGGLGIFLALGFITTALDAANRHATERRAEEARYNQTVTYYLGANDQKIEGDSHAYPVTSLRTNREGTSYSWVERTEDGTFNTRTVEKVPDERYEVTITDDLPASDTEPRVERAVDYQVKGEDVAAGKETCVEKHTRGDFGFLPACGKDRTEARFIKTRTIIHVPAGSFDKMVTVTSE